jgi:antitoxin (DNA-binding transcriptional repressor) of toxin-antitoxin stability system
MIVTMSTRVGIAELKAHLSEYIARAKGGERIVVCDRNTPVAEVTAWVGEDEPLPLIPATRPWSGVTGFQPLPRLPGIDLAEMLIEDRHRR